MIDENRLLHRLQEGREDALETAIQRYTPYLSAVIYRTAGGMLPREDVEEITADVFVSLWRHAGQIDLQRGSVRSYLAGAARNLARDRLRQQTDTVSLEEMDTEVEDSSVSRMQEELLWETVAALGEEDLEIFVRFYRYGETLKEIAGAMDRKLSTVKTRLSRGKKKLKQILTEEEEQ